MNYEAAMRLAIAEANRALEHGDVPIGAVALIDGEVVGARHNERERDQSPIAHAELLLVEQLARERNSWRLTDVTIVVTLEPCLMCAGALLSARVAGLIYGAYDPKAGACGTLFNVIDDPRLNHTIPTTGGLLADKCGAMLSSFFADKRGQENPRRNATGAL